MYELGGMPMMIKSEDMINTMPDEKLVITCVSFLCSRLLELRKEIRAAQVIQRFWRYNIYRKKRLWMSEKDKLLEKERQEQKEMLEKEEQLKQEEIKKKSVVKKKKKIGLSSNGPKKSPFKNGKPPVLSIKLMSCSPLPDLPAFQSASTIVKSTPTDSINGSGVLGKSPQKCLSANRESSGSPVLLINLMRNSLLGCKQRDEPKDGAGREAKTAVPDALMKEKEKSNIKSPINSEANKSYVQKKMPDFHFSVTNENSKKEIRSELKIPSKASPPVNAKTLDASGSKNFAVDNFSDETILHSIALDYDDEVVESLGLNMVDRTGTIYHTPKKETPLKRNVAKPSCTNNTFAVHDKPSRTAVVPKRAGNKNVSIDDRVKEVSSQSEIRLKIEKKDNDLDQEIFFRPIATPIIFRKKPMIPDKTRLKNNIFIETCKDSEDEDNSPAVETLETFTVKENYNSTAANNKRNTVEMSSGDFEPLDPQKETVDNFNELAGLPVIEKIESDINFINLFKNLNREELNLLEDQVCHQKKIEVEGKYRSNVEQKSEIEIGTGQTLLELKSSSELDNYNDLEKIILEKLDSIERDRSALRSAPNGTLDTSAVDPIDECCVGVQNLSIDSSHCLLKENRSTKERLTTCEEKQVKIFVSLLRQLWIKYLLMKCNHNPKLKGCLKIRHLLARKHFLQSLERDKDSSRFKMQSRDAIVFDTLKQEFANNLFKMIPSKKSAIPTAENHFGPKVESAKKLLGNSELSFIDRRWQNMRTKLICIQKTLKKHQTQKDNSKIHPFSQEEMSKENNLKDLEIKQDPSPCPDKDHLKKIILIQSVMRSYLAKVKYQRELTSIIRAQAHLRSFMIRKRVKLQRDRIVSLQSIARTYLVRKRYLEVTELTRECGYLQRIKLLRTSSVIIPTEWTEALSMSLRNESACKIQTAWRRFSVRRNYERTRMKMVNLQAVIRGHLVRKSYQGTFGCIRAVQIFGRAFLERRKHEEKLKKIILIQACFRMVIKRREFLKIKKQIILIQSLVRRKLCMIDFERQKNGIVLIQSIIRTFLQRKAGFKEKEKKAIKVQSHVRKYLARKSYLETLDKIRKCQAIAKGLMVRKQTRDLSEKVVVIQSFMRMTVERQAHLRNMENIRLLQRYCWSFIYSNRHRINMEKIVKAQAIVRGVICRKRYSKHLRSTLLIQKLARGFQARKKLRLQTRLASCLMHDMGDLVARNFVNVFNAFVLHQLQMTYCAIKIQSAWRKYSTRKSFLCIIQGFTRLQAVVRGQMDRRQAFERLKSIFVIQDWWRRVMMRKKMKIMIQLEIEKFNINKIEVKLTC